jgi:hypothetical protein
MQRAAEHVVDRWQDFDYGDHSLRIGRINNLRAGGARMSTVADISTHVMPQQGASNSGAMDGYVREDVEDLLSAQASALQTTEQPVETLLRVDSAQPAASCLR